MIFYMPTWRNWIKEANEEDFVKTDYYKAYSEILNSEKLAQILEKNNVNMVFCLHPKFRDYMHCIEVKSPNITTVGYDEGIAVNKLLMKCSMFITITQVHLGMYCIWINRFCFISLITICIWTDRALILIWKKVYLDAG